MKTTDIKSRTRTTLGLVGASLAVLIASACGGGGGGGLPGPGASAPAQTDSGGAITVWVDPPRVPAAEAFKKAHPEIQTTVNQIDGTVGSKALSQQFAQFNQAKQGWPDAIFFPSNDDIAWASGAQINYAADVTSLVPDTIKNYDPAILAPCSIDNKIRCLRNDAAPDVFWYNQKFFDANGYTPPKTWEDYGTLAVKIASEHPGKVSAFLGDAYAPDRYLWASGCPTNQRLTETSVLINLDDAKCQRAKKLVGEMVTGKAASNLGIFDADAAKAGKDLVMSPGALWWGDYLFRQTWKIDSGTMTATAPLTWQGESQPSTGNEGGGLWGVSSHITGKQLENTLTFAKFVVSDPRWQVELSTGLPAYGPVQDDWIAKQKATKYFADNDATFTAFKQAATYVPGDHAYTLYNTGGIWTETVAKDLVAGKSFDDAWTSFGSELNNQAKSQGYEVKTAS